MNYPLLSLIDPPPPGFQFRERLAMGEIRRGVFALYAPTPDLAERALAPWLAHVSGLLISPGEQVQSRRRPSGLLHLTVPVAEKAAFARWLPVVLDLLREESAQAERNRVLTLEVDRLAADRAQASAEFGDFRASLLQEAQERRKATEALHRSELHFRTIYNAVNDAIIVHDCTTGAILEVNQRACDLFGYTLEEIRQLPVSALSSGEPGYQQEHAEARMREAAMRPQMFTWRSRHKNGRLFWTEVNMRRAIMHDEDRILVTLRDITERKEAEEAQRRLEAQLLQTQKLESLGVLAGGIAHDFNNLLVAIIGNVDLALTELPEAAPGRSYLSEIEGAAHRAADLCRQMLAYAGRGSLDIQPLNLCELVHEMGHLLEISVAKSARLRYQLPDQLPAVHADTSQLRQVIMNLVLNASEALSEGGGSITIALGTQVCDSTYLADAFLGRSRSPGTYVYLEVSDTGSGMSAETLPKIFDPFFSTKFTGRGLGLATVFGVVRSHRGAIKLASEPGRGTTFRVLLPSLAEPADPLKKTAQPDSGWSGCGNVLVVDDDESVRTFTKHALEKSGFCILLAEDGQAGVDLFRAHQKDNPQAPIDCVLLDLTMPVMDGEEAFRALRALHPDLRIIVTSGYSEDDMIHRFAQEERLGFLQKPYRAAALRGALKSILAAP